MGGTCKGTDKDAVENGGWEMEYRVTLSIHPSQFQFHQFKRVYPSSCKIGSFVSSLPQAIFAVFKFRNSPNWRLFFQCVSLVFFFPRNWRWLNELCNYTNAWDEPEPDMAMKLATNGRQPGRLTKNGNSRMQKEREKKEKKEFAILASDGCDQSLLFLGAKMANLQR
ncbi:hypothetical protein SEVIR_1G364751v4 [Setaria viridis]